MTEKVKWGEKKAKMEGVVEINKKPIAIGTIKNTFFPFIIGMS
jgi:hypothetical protein